MFGCKYAVCKGDKQIGANFLNQQSPTALVTVNNQFPGLKSVWAEYLGFWDFKNINFIKIVLGLCQENGIKDS